MAENTTPKAAKLPDTKSATTAKGPHGGGTQYHTTTVKNEFFVVDGRPGHSQKANVTDSTSK